MTCDPILEAADVTGVDAPIDSTVMDAAIAATRTIMQSIAGGAAIGVCHETIRPYRVVTEHSMYDQHDRIALGPDVTAIDEVKIDGAVLATSEYALMVLHGVKHLVRLNADWPYGQNWKLADTETGTFSVTVSTGSSLDLTAKNAAVEIARELYKAAKEDRTCKMGRNVTTVNHQGVTVNYDAALADVGDEAIFPSVARWADTINAASRGRAHFHTPDIDGWIFARDISGSS